MKETERIVIGTSVLERNATESFLWNVGLGVVLYK